MNAHPGGAAHTRRMIGMTWLSRGASVLDLGAGAGESVALLRSMGFEAEGIDLEPRSPLVRRGDLLRADYPDESFDAVLSQCAFFLSGDVPGALREARRLIKPGGLLLLSDVFFEPPQPLLEAAGFQLRYAEDMTKEWQTYYLEALWREDTICPKIPHGKCGYWLLIAGKE